MYVALLISCIANNSNSIATSISLTIYRRTHIEMLFDLCYLINFQGTSSNFGLYIFLTIATVSIMMALLIMTHFVRKRFHKGNQPQNVYTMVSPNDPSNQNCTTNILE